MEWTLEHDNKRLLPDLTCQRLLQHRLLRPAIGTLERLEGNLAEQARPWTTGRDECLHRALKKGAVQRYHSQPTDELNEYLHALLLAYNHAKHLATLRELMPDEFICAQRQKNPATLAADLTHFTNRTINPDGSDRV